MRHAGLVAFLVLSGCLHAPPTPSTALPSAGTVQDAGGSILLALPTNMTLVILRPGTEMALMAVVDGSAVVVNTGQDDTLAGWATALDVRRIAVLVLTNPAAPFSGGCRQLASAAEVALLVAPSGTACEGAPSARALDSLRVGQVLQVGHISIGILSIQPLVATVDYGAVRILVAPEPACPTLTDLANDGLAAPDLLQLAEASPCLAWGDMPPAVAFATAPGEPDTETRHALEPGEAIAFTSDGTALAPLP